MATKKCAAEHCEELFEAKAARKFCDLHASKSLKRVVEFRKQLRVRRGLPEATINEAFTAFIVPIYVTEPQLDDFWTKLPIEEKALAIQLYWDNSNSSEETKTSAPTPEQTSND